MKISLNWLKDFVNINVSATLPSLKNVVVGYVKSVKNHPNADRLKVAQVDVGTETLEIVCGGTNLKEDIYVPVALQGTVLPGNFTIKKTTIRGIESNGMICHLSELGLAKEGNKEITIIEKYPPGTPFAKTIKNKPMQPEELAELLTIRTAEVDKVEREDKYLHNVVTGKLLSFEKIPNTEHHHKGIVDIGEKQITLVFGSVFKLKEGWILPIAKIGARLPEGEIKEAEIKGVLSQGMICSDKELGIENSKKGLTIFPENTPLGKPIAEILKLDDVIFEFDNKSLTHRPDLWGHYGIAREISAITGTKLKPYKTKITFPTTGENLKIEIKNPIISKRFCACLISDIEIKESPQWLKNRLQKIGITPVNNIVDVTNYVMLDCGQPMHAYDRDIVKTDHLVIDFAKDGQTVETIDHKTRKLSSKDMVVTNGEEFLGVAGVMGGANSEINDGTKNIILEAAHWNPSLLRQTTVKLGLRSEASQRFEKSLDPELCENAVKRAAELILKICKKAKIVSPFVDISTYTKETKKIELRISQAISKIGVSTTKNEIKNILKSLEFKVETKDKDTFIVTIPTFRATKDVTAEDDLIEEIVRMCGYENIPSLLPTLPTKLPIENTERFKKHRVRELFSYGLGFSEVYNYSFYGRQELKNCLMSEDGHLKLLNYLSEDQTHLRTTLIPNLLKNLQLNTKYFDAIKLYEIGRTYKELGEYFPLEEKKITGAILIKEKADSPFYEAKGAVAAFFKKFNFPHVQEAKGIKNAPYAHPIKAISYVDQNGATLAQVFMLHPLVQKNYDLEKYSIAMFEINFTEALKLEQPTKTHKYLPKFPSIKIDISVVIDRTTEIQKLQETISEADKTLITNVELFDIYEGENIESGKKAVAFQITLQAEDRTLTDDEMSQVQTKIFEHLEKIGGKIRGKN